METIYLVSIFFIFSYKNTIFNKMENRIEVVISSREVKENKTEFLENVQETCGCECNINYVYNPDGASLTSVYNKYIVPNDESSDIVVFIHDDIEFLRYGWGKRLIELFENNEEYGIIGVAGSAQFDEKGTWWTYDKKYGQVLHRKNGNSWLSTFSPLLEKDLEEVCVIDGLFMAVHKRRISQKFDEKFKGFNHYDTSFCLANYIDAETRIGVTTDIRIAHSSIGETKQNFFDNLILLNSLYHEYYPIDVEEDNKLDELGKL